MINQVFCPHWEVLQSEYACARRYENAVIRKVGPGAGDFRCIECEIGKRLFETGAGKIKPMIKNKKEGGKTMPGEEKTETKICKKCGRDLPIDQFSKHPTTKDGREGSCRDCRNAAAKERRAKGNPPKKSLEKMADGTRRRITVSNEITGKRPAVLSLNLSAYPDLAERLHASAVENFRTIEMQAMYLLHKYTSESRP